MEVQSLHRNSGFNAPSALSDDSRPETRRRDAGKAIVEFIMVVPLILLLALAAIEFSRYFKEGQDISLLSRETANLVYRECATLAEPGIAPCVVDRINSIVAPHSERFSGISVDARIYRTGVEPLIFPPTDPLGPKEEMRLTETVSAPRFETLLASAGLRVVVTVRADYVRIVPLVNEYWPNSLYEITVL